MSETKTAIEKLYQLLDETKSDYVAGYNGTKAAARRGRKALQDVRQLAKEAREELLAVSKEEIETIKVEL